MRSKTTSCTYLVQLGLLGLLVSCSQAADDEAPTASTWAALMQDGDTSSIVQGAAGTATPAPRNCSDCTAVPLAYWRFDDCNTQSTELADTAYTSAITHPAYRAVSAACVAGHQGQAVQISGSDDIVYSPDQPDYDFSQGLTIAAWINPTAVNRTQSIVRKRLDGTSSFTLAIEAKRVEFVLRLKNGKLVGVTAPIQAGQFSHVAGTYDGKQLLLYVNGAVAAQAKAVGTIAPGVGPIFVGNDADGRQFKGVVDEVWLNTFAAPAATIRGLNCVHKPPVLTLTPGDTPPEQPNTPVAFDLSVTNPSDATFCPADSYEIYAANVPYPLNADTYFDYLTVNPGQTQHVTVNVTASDVGLTGPFAFQYEALSAVDYSVLATASATFELAAPVPPTRTGCLSTPPQPVAPGGYYVNGNTICTADGRVHQFHGVNRPSLEWEPSGTNLSLSDFELMSTWNANAVRIALNQDFWLQNSPLANPYYPAIVDDAIAWAEMAGMDVILDLHWSDAGVLGGCAPSNGCQQLMPDVNSLTFWTQVASRYKNDGRVQFELYNEPHDVTWDVWRNGGDTGMGWQAVGMQQLYDAVRATGAQNLTIIGGLDWAYDLSGVPANRIAGYNIVYATHPYGPYRTTQDWGRAWGSLTYTDPVIATEFGMLNDTACTTDYSAQVIQYADAHFASWTAWAWYPGGCTFPAVITDWSGTPSAVGAIVKSALLGYNDPPASPPLPSTPGPDVNFTFDREPQAWTFSNYADPTYTNLGATVPSGGSAPSLTINTIDGDPNPGSLQITAPYTAFDQYVDVIVGIDQPGLNLTGKTLHAYVRQVSGSLAAGGLQMHASTGPNWTWGSTTWVNGSDLTSGAWVPLTLDLGAVTSSGFDPSEVVQIGVQFFVGFASNGGTYVNNGPVILEIDTVTD